MCAAVVAGGVAGAAAVAAEQAKEQFIPMLTFKVGPAGALGIATNAGYLDYWTLLNIRDGGIGGVKITWEECETDRKVEKGIECYEKLKHKGPIGASVVNPIATDIAYALLERSREDRIPTAGCPAHRCEGAACSTVVTSPRLPCSGGLSCTSVALFHGSELHSGSWAAEPITVNCAP